MALAGGALLAAGLLVWFAGYHPSLIDVVDGERSNTTPPTLYTAVAGMVQVGLLMVVAGGLDRVATRHRSLLDRAGAAAVGVYVWHLTALAICAGAIAAGFWAPARFSAGWWISRPLWFVVVLGLTGALVALTAWGTGPPPAPPPGSRRAGCPGGARARGGDGRRRGGRPVRAADCARGRRRDRAVRRRLVLPADRPPELRRLARL
jgi:hypothetical protein